MLYNNVQISEFQTDLPSVKRVWSLKITEVTTSFICFLEILFAIFLIQK